MSSAALRRSASVNSASFNLRELSSSSSASSRRDNSVAFTQVYYRVLRVTSSRPSVAPRRAAAVQSPMFNRADVQSSRSSLANIPPRRFPSATLCNRSSYLQLLQTVNTQTLKTQTVHSRLQLLQQLLLSVRSVT